MAKRNKGTFAKREKELRRMRKAAEKMARRHAKRDLPKPDGIEIVVPGPSPEFEAGEQDAAVAEPESSAGLDRGNS